MNPISKSWKAIRDLGFKKLWLYALYQLGLRSGHFRRATPCTHDDAVISPSLAPYLNFPSVSITQKKAALAEADLILNGRVRLFGGPPVNLDLSLGASKEHWTALEVNPPTGDIKNIWEPARFGWAVTLARAYAFSDDPVYAQDFWHKTLKFLSDHPPNRGRQWQSGQEVALRLMVWVFCDRIFAQAPSSTSENRRRLWQAIAEHARRIPPTLIYARAQNNNHLLSEAAALYTAGLYLQDHPQASKWHEMGWHWLNWALQNQIDEFGTYIQHSTNYHRLMLQLALSSDHIRRSAGAQSWPEATKERLSAATRWLWALTDPNTGGTPNLGANDGALILPIASLPYDDYRPVVDAAAKAFLHQDIYTDPDLSEMAGWFDLAAPAESDAIKPHAPDMLQVKGDQGRAFLRAARFCDRPSHADQLHVDLWWQGVNVAQDPGSYLYNAAAPWDNALARTSVHNTLMVDGQEQMLPVGRFLWLDWAQAEVIIYEMDAESQITRVTAEHYGYRKQGAIHQRTLQTAPGGWIVADSVLPYGKADDKYHHIQLTWLLPDWKWQITPEQTLQLDGPNFRLSLSLKGISDVNLFRAGKRLYGDLPGDPTWGWHSPTYSLKQPALMLVAPQRGQLPMHIQSIWQFDPPGV